MSYRLYDYGIKLFHHENDRDYIAYIEEIPSISAFAETPENAIKELEAVFKEYQGIQEEDGEALPEPFKFQEFSGKTMIHLPKSLHKLLEEQAKRDDISLNQEIVYCITKGLQMGNFLKSRTQRKRSRKSA